MEHCEHLSEHKSHFNILYAINALKVLTRGAAEEKQEEINTTLLLETFLIFYVLVFTLN